MKRSWPARRPDARTSRFVALAFVLVATLGAWKAYAVHDLHALEGRLNDPNPVEARAVGGIRPSLSVPLAFERRVIDARTFDGGRKPKIFIDPDGRGSVVGAQVGPGGFALYPPGGPPARVSRYSRVGGAEDAQAADVDGDGAPDIVVGGLGHELYVLLNPLHTACSDVYRCAWKRTVIERERSSHDIVVGDVDRDGTIDIATESGIYFNQRKGGWAFVGRDRIPRDGAGTGLADLEGDGLLDVVAPYRSGTVLARFVNPRHHRGDPLRDAWHVQAIDDHPRFTGNMTTAVADVNGDGRNDIILAPMYGGGGLVWYEAPPLASGQWRRHVVDATVNFVHQGSLQPADFGMKGRRDIAFAEQDQSPSRRIGIFLNVKGDGSKWQLQVLSTEGGHNIKVGMLGSDTRPSILSARHGYAGGPNPLIVWRNVRTTPKPRPRAR